MTYEPVTLETLLRHQVWALRLARRLVREEDEAEDLVQRTWMAALRRPPDSERGARAWIGKVILNLARERHRRNKTRELYERASLRTPDDEPDALESLSRQELRGLLGEHLLHLHEPYRSVLLLRFYEGLSSVEIARRLGVPSGTIRWRLKVGLDQLRDELDRRSHGDRSRWVSSLLVLARESEAPPGRERASEEGVPADGPGWLASAGWLALVAAGVTGVILLLRTPSRAAGVDVAVLGSAAAPLGRDGSSARAPEPSLLERSPLSGSSAPAAAAPEDRPGIPIVVRDPAGAVVPSARILVAQAVGFEERATSGEDGRVWLPVEPDDAGALGLASTRGRVSVRALGPGRVASELVHVGPPFTHEHEVTLLVGAKEAVLSGRVLDQDGEVVGGALVAWFHPRQNLQQVPEGDFASPSYVSAESDEQGEFRLENLAPLTGNLGCFAPGFAIYSRLVDPLAADGPYDVVLERGATVTGRVRGPDGRPVADALVSCEPFLKAAEWATGLPRYDASWRGFGETTRTDADGRYRLEGVGASGRVRALWARDERSHLVDSTRILLESGAEERWDAVLGERQGFRLRLVDEDDRPLHGWFAQLSRPMMDGWWWTRRLPADEHGRVVVTDCIDGEAFLDVFAPTDVGASYAWRRLMPSDEERLVVVETKRASTVSGRLVDALGNPELRGRLECYSLQTTLSTVIERDEHGNFEARLVPGNYGLVLQHDRTAARLARFALKAGEHRDFGTLALPPMGMLRLEGLGAVHAQKPAFTLYALGEEGDKSLLVVGTGMLVDEVLISAYPGRYRLEVFDGSGAKPRPHTLRIEPYTETRLDLRRAP